MGADQTLLLQVYRDFSLLRQLGVLQGIQPEIREGRCEVRQAPLMLRDMLSRKWPLRLSTALLSVPFGSSKMWRHMIRLSLANAVHSPRLKHAEKGQQICDTRLL
ncbi:hypothetical protein JTB14_025168 [Gonioctena quinquepunctata]|nr:hypothetical protein JTB14_025168 [Gonioctena quinquepunctata]